MVQKRQLAEEEYDVSPKHLKLEHGCQLVSFLEFPPKEVPLEPYTSGKTEGCFYKPVTGCDCEIESDKTTDLQLCTKKDVACTPGCLSTSSWSSTTTSEEDALSEIPTLTPEKSPLKPRTLIQPEDTYSYLLGRPPLKGVPVGPEYQADIPQWSGYEISEANSISYGAGENKFMGSCVIPMSEVDPTICNDDSVGRGRTDCCCRDPGSLRCVQQHIREARERLKGEIEHEQFAELGFGNMGEVVANKWTEEDEQLYNEIVYSNPASFGKNFWDHLASVFPERTNQEIVSYYFNVFMLRKREEQNRYDPMNIDSDDDEWQGSDTPVNSCYDNAIKNPITDNYEDVKVFHDLKESTNFSETQHSKLVNSCSIDSTSPPMEQNPAEENGGDRDSQDDSCTSSDAGVVAPRASDGSKSWGSHEFIFEPSDSKVWDVGYFSCPRSTTDFLPTCSMIEEVFGVESWNFNDTDD